MASSRGRLVIDMRAFDNALRCKLTFAVVDKLMEMGCNDELIIVTDHEPVGIGYQIDLRKETRGKFQFEFKQRSDGAWVAMISNKRA